MNADYVLIGRQVAWYRRRSHKTQEQLAEECNLSVSYLSRIENGRKKSKHLVSCQAYQRRLSEKHVKDASANFDLYQINPVKVSRRDGINYVFNGQHTIEIVATVSGSR